MASRRVWGLMALLSAVACGEVEGNDGRFGDASEPTVGEQMCEAMAAQLASCGQPTECESAIASDCTPLVEVLSESFVTALRDCLEAGGSPASCILPALDDSEPSPSHEAFVSKFCSECAVGAPGCDALFSASAPEALAPVRSLLLALSDDVVAEVTEACTSGLSCAAEFASCVEGVLAKRALPEQALSCTIETLMSPPTEAHDCGPSSTNVGAGGSTTSGPGGSGGTGGTGGTGGSGGTDSCNDVDSEPNGSETSVVPLGTLYDCDAAATAGGTIDGPGDGDWFRFTGYDDYCWAEPTVSLSAGDPSIRVCMFFECLAGQTEVSCPTTATAATSPEGLAGCCGPASGLKVTTLNCTGTINDDAQVYVRIDEPNATTNACHDYTLSYEY